MYLQYKVTEVSRSGYYSWRKRGQSAREREREQLIPMVKAIHKKSRLTYGKRGIAEEYPNIFDKTLELSEKYQLNKVLSPILIDKNGIVKMKLNSVPIVEDLTLKMLNASLHFAQDNPVEVNERVER